jgi:hypothetical protein
MFAVASGLHHAPANIAFREYLPINNPYENPFHAWALGQMIVVDIILSLALLNTHSFVWASIAGVMNWFWYGLLFDPVLNKNVPGRSWDFIGNSSSLDILLKKKFGKNAGEIKSIFLVFAIIIINVLKFIL